jgi:uncharacterized protein (DUF58 family)
MAATVADLRQRALAYAERRLPALTRLRKPEPLPIPLDRRRIYVLPTGFGITFALLLFVMLLGALNYSNNPATLLTCLLAAACGASLFSGFRAVNGLSLARLSADECHAGEPLALRLRFDTSRPRASLCLRRDTMEIPFSLTADSDEGVVFAIPSTTRGWLRPGRLRLSTEYPLGLFRVWSWLNPDAAFLVYPAVETLAPPLPSGVGSKAERTRPGPGDEASGLRDYRVTDPPRLIAWKASARHDMLLVRDAERRVDDALVLDYSAISGLDHEARLRRLTAWVLAAEAAQREYTLHLPDHSIGPGLGGTHRHASLRALALAPFDA